MNTKTITITVDVDGNAISRSYVLGDVNWQEVVESMLDTLEKSQVIEF